jgi:hypothetical protein
VEIVERGGGVVVDILRVGANNYANSLMALERFEEAKSLMRKTIPVARRVIGEGHRLTLKTRWNYAKALYRNASATLNDLREAVATLDELTRTARRVLGGANPVTTGIEDNLRRARAALRARETPPADTPIERTFARGWLDGSS